MYLREHALLKNNNWDAFVEEIKTKNRFHSKLINFDILEKYCSFIRKPYKKESCFIVQEFLIDLDIRKVKCQLLRLVRV